MKQGKTKQSQKQIRCPCRKKRKLREELFVCLLYRFFLLMFIFSCLKLVSRICQIRDANVEYVVRNDFLIVCIVCCVRLCFVVLFNSVLFYKNVNQFHLILSEYVQFFYITHFLPMFLSACGMECKCNFFKFSSGLIQAVGVIWVFESSASDKLSVPASPAVERALAPGNSGQW